MDCSSGVSTMMSVKRDAGIRRAHKHALLKWDRGMLDGEGVHGPLRFFLFIYYTWGHWGPERGIIWLRAHSWLMNRGAGISGCRIQTPAARDGSLLCLSPSTASGQLAACQLHRQDEWTRTLTHCWRESQTSLIHVKANRDRQVPSKGVSFPTLSFRWWDLVSKACWYLFNKMVSVMLYMNMIISETTSRSTTSRRAN